MNSYLNECLCSLRIKSTVQEEGQQKRYVLLNWSLTLVADGALSSHMGWTEFRQGRITNQLIWNE